MSLLVLVPLRKMPNWPFRPRSMFLRYSVRTPGLVAKSRRSCSEKTCCSRPWTGDTQVGSRMKVVHFLTWG